MVVVKLRILSIRVELEHSTVRYRCLISCTNATTATHINQTAPVTGKNVRCAGINKLLLHIHTQTIVTNPATPVDIQDQYPTPTQTVATQAVMFAVKQEL